MKENTSEISHMLARYTKEKSHFSCSHCGKKAAGCGERVAQQGLLTREKDNVKAVQLQMDHLNATTELSITSHDDSSSQMSILSQYPHC